MVQVRFGNQTIQVRVEGAAIVARQSLLAQIAAEAAQSFASAAEAFAGPTFPDTAAGLAGTTDGQSFAVNEDGIVTIYLNDEGDAVAQRVIATTAALASPSKGAALVATIGTAANIATQSLVAGIKTIRTDGYAVTGDGGGAFYKRVGTEPSHAGKVQSADGAWWEIAERVIDVRMLGAIGDGATNNTAALQSEIDVGVALGAPVFVPSGVFVTGPLAMPSGLTLEGESMWLSVLRLRQNNSFGGPTAKNAVLTNANVIPAEFGGSGARDRDITVRDLCLDGNRANQSGTSSEAECLSFYGAEDCYVENLRLINAVADGYDLDYCDRIGARNLIIDNCGKTGAHLSIGAPQGINMANDDCWIERATITNCLAAGLTDAHMGGKGYRNRFRDITIKDCSDEGVSGGVRYTGSFSSHSHDAIIDGVTVDGVTASGVGGSGIGILLENMGGTASNLMASNTAGGGITVYSSNQMIINVTTRNTGTGGFTVNGVVDGSKGADVVASNVFSFSAGGSGVILNVSQRFRGANINSFGAAQRGLSITGGGVLRSAGLASKARALMACLFKPTTDC